MTEIADLISGALIAGASFLVAMSVVIIIHELGHYLAARSCGVRSDKFSFGFGPALISRTDRRGTSWALSAIPLGGYVRFPASGTASGRPLNEAGIAVRLFVVMAGPVANFILSAALFSAVALSQGAPSERMEIGLVHQSPPGWANDLLPGDLISSINGREIGSWQDLVSAPPQGGGERTIWGVVRGGHLLEVDGPPVNASRISAVTPRLPAARAGVREGDVMVAIDGDEIRSVTGSRAALDGRAGETVRISLWNADGGYRDVDVMPVNRAAMTETGMRDMTVIGINAGFGMISPKTESVGIIGALSSGSERTVSVITGSFRGLTGIVFGSIGACNMGGAITIAENSAHAASAGFLVFAVWVAALSAAIGFFNLLPIPGLDGGHVVTFLYEAAFRRPPSQQIIGHLAFIGTALIVFLMVFGVASDLVC